MDGSAVRADLDGAEQEYPIEEALFFLLERGIPYNVIFGYEDGWDLERLVRLFCYLKRREIEMQKSATVAVSIGASSLFKQDAIKKFLSESDKMLRAIEQREKLTEDVDQDTKVERVKKSLSMLGMFLGKK